MLIYKRLGNALNSYDVIKKNGSKANIVAYRADNKPHAAPACMDQAAVALIILLYVKGYTGIKVKQKNNKKIFFRDHRIWNGQSEYELVN